MYGFMPKKEETHENNYMGKHRNKRERRKED